MAVTAKGEGRKLTVRQRKGRAVNAVAEMLRKRLSVPNIYLEPRSSYIDADVLAVDRAGAGDLHAVEIEVDQFLGRPETDPRRRLQQLKEITKALSQQLFALPSHYKYLAVPRLTWRFISEVLEPVLYAPDGIGRIGVIEIVEIGDDPPFAELLIAPERFRVDAAKLNKIEKNLINNKKVRPDIEVRI